jgi:hypothetical protein
MEGHTDHIFIAIIAALVNLILSIIVPCALKNHTNILPEIRKMLEFNRSALLTSSGLVFVIVWIALSISPQVRSEIPAEVLRLANL